MTKVKFCGLKRAEDIEVANDLEVDYVGFVFAPRSKRCIAKEKAKELKALVNPQIKTVGIFVNAPLHEIRELYQSGIIDIAQLHGTETEGYIAELKKVEGLTIIDAISIMSEKDIEKANASAADFVLVDSIRAGSGKTFDWDLLKGMKRDYFLAGGLNEGNVMEAVAVLKPYAVDVSTGIEKEELDDNGLMKNLPGIKDEKKMKAFVMNVKEVE